MIVAQDAAGPGRSGRDSDLGPAAAAARCSGSFADSELREASLSDLELKWTGEGRDSAAELEATGRSS